MYCCSRRGIAVLVEMNFMDGVTEIDVDADRQRDSRSQNVNPDALIQHIIRSPSPHPQLGPQAHARTIRAFSTSQPSVNRKVERTEEKMTVMRREWVLTRSSFHGSSLFHYGAALVAVSMLRNPHFGIQSGWNICCYEKRVKFRDGILFSVSLVNGPDCS